MNLFRILSRKSVVDLTPEHLQTWDTEGALILPRFFSSGDLARFRAEVDELWRTRAVSDTPIVVDILEGELTGRRMRLRDAPDSVRGVSHKVNDLYLESEACRSLNLNPRLVKALTKLLGDEPAIINSLTFEKGSQQPLHFDTYYMPPPVDGKMVVSFICLEDFGPEAGPLAYVPGSHKIPAYVFSHGKIGFVPDEMPAAKAYIDGELEARRMTTKTFCGHAGDVFIWHAQLYHGGMPIKDPTRTRRSLVTHYWRARDLHPTQIGRGAAGGAYFKRDHQPAPA